MRDVLFVCIAIAGWTSGLTGSGLRVAAAIQDTAQSSGSAGQGGPAIPADERSLAERLHKKGASDLRVATFNCSLFRKEAGSLSSDLKQGNEQARKVAAVIQRVRPDLVLLNEFDFDESEEALKLFRDEYLGQDQPGSTAIRFEYAFTAPVNTGVDSGLDLNSDGKLGSPDDAFGFGLHPGQYGMVVLSRFEIDSGAVRTFQKFLWRDMPGALLPVHPATGQSWYSEQVLSQFRLSSKSHWDVPVKVGNQTLHLLASHPTPPVFDGAEDRNGKRNHDEIRLWADYISGQADYLHDDAGNAGGLAKDAFFVIAGDLNADPHDGASTGQAARLLTSSSCVADPLPTSRGGSEATQVQAGLNAKHSGPPEQDTGDFGDENVGNLRIDFVLPSVNLKVSGSGVFWPASDDPDAHLADVSDHHLVWIDLELPDK